jgi:hypothetical protein
MVAELVNTYHDDEIIIPGKLPVSPELAAEIKARARIRDLPHSCWCYWRYSHAGGRWFRVAWDRGCPWHHGYPQ